MGKSPVNQLTIKASQLSQLLLDMGEVVAKTAETATSEELDSQIKVSFKKFQDSMVIKFKVQ